MANETPLQERKVSIQILLIVVFCIMAAGVNFGLNSLFVFVFRIPLFLDTMFTAAVTFILGLWPGLFTAVLTQILMSIRKGNPDPFVICVIVEVLLIWRLNPVKNAKRLNAGNIPVGTSIFARLLFLYIICCISVSILGGIIDFFYYGTWLFPKPYFSAEDTFKIGLLQSDFHLLAINILSRIPVNIIDRFIVIFGGFFLSKGFLALERVRRLR